MATVSRPYGLRPVGLLSGRPYNGAFRQIKIASGLASNIFNGDVVKLVTTGTIDKETTTTTLTTSAAVGVFVGCTYTDPGLSYKVHRNYWPTGTVASDAYGYVVDDPDTIFMAQADGAVAQTGLGNNIAMIQTAGNTQNGKSRVTLDASSIAPDGTLPFRIVGFVEGGGSTVGDAFTDCLVMFTPTLHHYRSADGI